MCVWGGDTGGSAERPRVPTAPHGPAVPPYLQATLAGAHDGAEVAGGAARAALGRRPQQVEGAAVTGALGAFAGDTGIEDMGVAVPKAALSRSVLCPQQWHLSLQHGGHGGGCPQSEDPKCHPPCGTAVCGDRRSWGAARVLLPPARSPAVAPTRARWDIHRVWGWQLPQQSPQGYHPPCAQGPQCLGTPGGQNLGLAPPFHATTCVPSGVTHLGTARLPVPGCSGSQRRRMVVARPPLHDCVTSLDLWWHRGVGGQQGPWSPSHTPGGLAPSRPHL